MACEVEGGSAGPFGVILSDWIGFFLNAWLAYEMLEAQEESEEQMEKIANVSLDAAEELFAAHMELRGRDPSVYKFMNNQPRYSQEDRDENSIQSKIAATRFIKSQIGNTSRYECGARKRIIRQALDVFVTGTESEREGIRQFEISVEDAYTEGFYESIVSSALDNPPANLAGSLGSAGALWAIESESQQKNAAGALAGLSYFGVRSVGSLF